MSGPKDPHWLFDEDGNPKGGQLGRGAQRHVIDAAKEAFLNALSITGIIADACNATGVARSTQQNWRRDPEFAERFEHAMQAAADSIEAEARKRAMGYEEPVIDPKIGIVYARNPDGSLKLDDDFQPIPLTRRVHSDMLMAKMLEAKKSEFRTKSVEHGGVNGAPLLPTKIVLKFVRSDGNGGALIYDTPAGLLEDKRAPDEVIDVESREFDPLED